MKHILSLVSLSVSITLSAFGQDYTPKPFMFKSGIIEYRFSGYKSGKAIQYFDDYGMLSSMYSETVQNGKMAKSRVVTKGDKQYMWDPEQPARGMKMKNPVNTWINESSRQDIESYTESLYKKMGMVKDGKETYLGKECDVYKGDSGKVLLWNGILILMDFGVGTYTSRQEAISIQTDVRVDPEYFIIPSDIVFAEMPSF